MKPFPEPAGRAKGIANGSDKEYMESNTSDTGSIRPNVVIIVLDCARADTVRAMCLGPTPQLPFVSWLLEQAVWFPRTAAPSAWTIPSHASLFTGLNPWEHRVHYKSSLRLDQNTPTLATTLRASGYATFLASANGFLSPPSGLLNGFEVTAWGESWERLLRISSKVIPASGNNCGATTPEPLTARLATVVPELGFRGYAAIAMDAANYFVARVRNPSAEFYPTISRWIEPTFERWLAQQNGRTPILAFVNLYDAHEPYFLTPELRREPGTWGKFARNPVDGTGFLAGEHPLSPELCQVQHRLYRSILIQLDRRVQTIVEALRRAGRWENTLFVLTSDHGQCFGEHDYLYHERRIWEPIARIPLVVRFPNGVHGGREASGWASLVDVYPTVMDLAGVSSPRPRGSFGLEQLLTTPRPAPTWSIADGIFRSERNVQSFGSPERANYWDRVLVAGYDGTTKIILDATSGQFEYYNVESDPAESVNLTQSPERGGPDMASMAAAYGRELLQATPSPPSEEVSKRLRSWGY
jgi:arylsulfatase A-like enzyme